jgi:hypothetical protein
MGQMWGKLHHPGVNWFQVSGVGCSAGGGSAQPSAQKTADLIEKETLKKRISNIE